MAKTAKKKRSPKRAPAKRDHIVDLLDIRPAKRATRSPEQKKELEEYVARAFVDGMNDFGAVIDRPLTPLPLPKLRERAEEPPENKKRLQPQQELCRRMFPRLFPDGRIPDEVELSTESLKQMIAFELEREAKQTGKKPLSAPGWDAVYAARRNPKSE